MLTFLTKIGDNRFVTIETVSEESIWTYNPEVFLKDNRHVIVLFKNLKVEVVVDTYENQITVRRNK